MLLLLFVCLFEDYSVFYVGRDNLFFVGWIRVVYLDIGEVVERL